MVIHNENPWSFEDANVDNKTVSFTYTEKDITAYVDEKDGKFVIGIYSKDYDVKDMISFLHPYKTEYNNIYDALSDLNLIIMMGIQTYIDERDT